MGRSPNQRQFFLNARPAIRRFKLEFCCNAAVVTTVSVLPLNSQVLPGHNQETYQRLQAAVWSTPPPQVWLATCDDLPLQRQLAATLEESLQRQGAIATATQYLFHIDQPNLVQQLQARLPLPPTARPPLLQILGIEQLTYCSSDTQYQFLRSLHQVGPFWRSQAMNLLLWLPRPWLKQIRREVPRLAQSVFEFIGEPTPISTMAQPPAYQAAFAPVRRWQFLGKPAPEVPAPPAGTAAEADPVRPASTAVPAVPSDPAPAADEPAVEPALPTFSEALWEQLQADLSEFEIAELAPEPASPPLLDPEPTAADETVVASTESSGPSPVPADRLTAIADTELGAQSAAELPVPEWGSEDQRDWAIAFEWRDRIQAGDHSLGTLVAAIQVYERLQPRQSTTPQRTEVLNDLGSLYWLWAQQAPTPEDYWQRLTLSSELYEAALSPLSQQTAAGVLNRLHSNLGSVYSLLAAHQDPPYFLGKAVRAFHRALQYVPIEVMPEEYATLQTHLGTAYWSLAQHTQEPTHLHRAIAAYQEALRQSQPQQVPQAYAQLQNNLGIALWSLSRHERPVFLLEQAIAAYRTALAYRTPDADAAGHAATQNNLGTAYWDLGGHCEERSPAQQQAWQQAITAYDAALTTVVQVPAEQCSFDPWATHHSIGVVCDQRAIAFAPDTAAQEPLLRKATAHYVSALTGWHQMDATTTDTALQALVRNLQLQARYLGMETQQRSLSQVPADWLPEIWRKL